MRILSILVCVFTLHALSTSLAVFGYVRIKLEKDFVCLTPASGALLVSVPSGCFPFLSTIPTIIPVIWALCNTLVDLTWGLWL